jgi:hypothetical protein
MPAITGFPDYGTLDITNTGTITPGAYRDIKLGGNKTITLSGPGTYVFRLVSNSGGTNDFKFDFKNATSGDFLLYFHEDVNLGK